MEPWEANVRRVTPYVPGEQPKDPAVIKLNTNENPYPPAPGVVKALQELKGGQLRLYPDPGAGMLVQAIADRYGVDREQVFVGVGSDDVLAMAFLTFFNSKNPILFPDITYSFYDVWAELFQIPYESPALDENFQIKTADYLRPNGGIVIANPNAPTGIALPLSEIRRILDANPQGIVIIDEAYIDFGGDSAVSLIPEYGNLLVVRTFSKSMSLAGMRLGFALGQTRLIRYLHDVKYSFNSYTMSQAALHAGTAAILDEAYFKETIAKIAATRERVKRELSKLGFIFGDSKANFIFASHPRLSASELFLALKEKHIYVRYFDKPRIENYLRITIGTDEEMDVLLSFLRDYVSDKG